jgi:hypothetical protein
MLAGLLVGPLVGLLAFLVVSFMPSDEPPIDLDGGAPALAVLLFIAFLFMSAGGVIGCLVGPLLVGVYKIVGGGASSPDDLRGASLKLRKAASPLDEDFW